MNPNLLIPIILLFTSLAVLVGLGASAVLARTSPERRRLREMTYPLGGAESVTVDRRGLIEHRDPRLEQVVKLLPKSPKEMSRLRRRLAAAGITSFGAAVLFSVAEIVLPIAFGLS